MMATRISDLQAQANKQEKCEAIIGALILTIFIPAFAWLLFSGTITPDPGWYSPTTTAIGSSYQIRITPTSGSFSTGTVNTWLTMSTNRTWTLSTTSFATVSFTIGIRSTTSTTVLASTTGNTINCEYVIV